MRKNFLEPLVIFILVLATYGYFSSGLDYNVNSRLALVKAVVEKGVLEIDSYQGTELRTSDKARFNKHVYSDKAIGSSVLGIIIYYPIYWFYSAGGFLLSLETFCNLLTFLCISLPAASIAPFLYLLTKQITDDSMKAMVITLALGLGTPLFKYSTAYYGHALAATAYFFAVLIWFYARRRNFISLKMALISSILLGYMLITEYPTALLGFLLVPYILYALYGSGQLFDWKIYAIMAVGFLIPLSLLLSYNETIFGSMFATGYSFEASETFNLAHEQNLMGIGLPNFYNFWYQSFQPAFGIFWQSPILFLALPGWFFMFKSKEYRAEACLSIAVILLYFVMFSGYYMWWGGLSASPRHLIPVLPIFALPLAFVPKKLWGLMLLGTFISIFQNLVLTASGFQRLSGYFNNHLLPAWGAQRFFQPGGMLVYDVSLPNIIKGNLTANRGMDIIGLKGPASLVPLLILQLGLILKYFRLIHPKTTPQETIAH
jgi:hypothetical protein